MLNKEILYKIENNEITSRRQLYKITGRSKKLLQWLNDNNILIPNVWTKEKFIYELKKTGKIKANENWNLYRLAKKYYGTWNKALEEVFGEVNQHRYTELTNEDLISKIRNFIIKYKRLPLREEFNGTTYDLPYYETIIKRLNVQKWSEVFKFIDLSNISYFYDNKHGTGKIIIDDDIVYFSSQEYLIGKYLKENNIKFEKEVPYKNCNYIFDFYLPNKDVYIEYYGLATKEYKQRIKEKQKKYSGRKVIEIFKHDNTIKKLALEVQRL